MSAASDALAAGLGAPTESVRAACNDPANAIRLLHAPTSLARASADFTPTSYDDAVAVRDDVANVLDGEARLAADSGDAVMCRALRAPRTAVVDGPATRGVQLPRLVVMTRAASLPAPTLADQLYADMTRADELVAAAWRGSASCPP